MSTYLGNISNIKKANIQALVKEICSDVSLTKQHLRNIRDALVTKQESYNRFKKKHRLLTRAIEALQTIIDERDEKADSSRPSTRSTQHTPQSSSTISQGFLTRTESKHEEASFTTTTTKTPTVRPANEVVADTFTLDSLEGADVTLKDSEYARKVFTHYSDNHVLTLEDFEDIGGKRTTSNRRSSHTPERLENLNISDRIHSGTQVNFRQDYVHDKDNKLAFHAPSKPLAPPQFFSILEGYRADRKLPPIATKLERAENAQIVSLDQLNPQEFLKLQAAINEGLRSTSVNVTVSKDPQAILITDKKVNYQVALQSNFTAAAPYPGIILINKDTSKYHDISELTDSLSILDEDIKKLAESLKQSFSKRVILLSRAKGAPFSDDTTSEEQLLALAASRSDSCAEKLSNIIDEINRLYPEKSNPPEPHAEAMHYSAKQELVGIVARNRSEESLLEALTQFKTQRALIPFLSRRSDEEARSGHPLYQVKASFKGIETRELTTRS